MIGAGIVKQSDVISNGCSSKTIAPFYAIVHAYVEDICTPRFTNSVTYRISDS